jgi:hypothetical protein
MSAGDTLLVPYDGRDSVLGGQRPSRFAPKFEVQAFKLVKAYLPPEREINRALVGQENLGRTA